MLKASGIRKPVATHAPILIRNIVTVLVMILLSSLLILPGLAYGYGRTHAFLTIEATETWPGGGPDCNHEICSYLKPSDQSRYNKLINHDPSDTNEYSGSTILEGDVEEDGGKRGLVGSQLLNEWVDHFWDPINDRSMYIDDLMAIVDASCPILTEHVLTAFEKASILYSLAHTNHKKGNRESAYYYLGRSAHLLQDMAVPAHVNGDVHAINKDVYEEWTGQNINMFTWNNYPTEKLELNSSDLIQEADIPLINKLLSSNLNNYFSALLTKMNNYQELTCVQNDNESKENLDFWIVRILEIFQFIQDENNKDNLSTSLKKLKMMFFNMARASQYFPSNDSDEIDLDYSDDAAPGDGILHSSAPYPGFVINESWPRISIADIKDCYAFDCVDKLQLIADRLIPRAIQFTAALYELFWHETHPPEITSVSVDPNMGCLSSTSRQWVTINGNWFLESSKVVLNDGSTNYEIPPERTEFVNSTEIKVCAGLQGAANWTAKIVNPANESNIFSFHVAQQVVRSLTVASFNPNSGVYIYVGPNDNNGLADDTTQFTRIYNDSTEVTLVAPSIAGGNNFNSWSGCNSTSGTTCYVTMDASKTVTANYATPPPTTYSLTVASSNPSSGVSITVSPNDVNGQSNGSTQFIRTYNNDMQVTLTAPSTVGSNSFNSWSGCNSMSGTTCYVTLDANKSVTANYAPPPTTYSLTVASSNPSSGVSIAVSPDDNSGQGAGTTQFSRTFNNGISVTLSAPSFAGSNSFSYWNGCDSSSGNTCYVTLNASKLVTAVYAGVVPTRILTVSSSNPSSGVSINVSPYDINNQSGGVTQFARIHNDGTGVTLTAPATASGNNFHHWTGCDSTSGLSCSVLMSADRTATATFSSISDLITFKLPDTGQTECYDGSGNIVNCAGTGQDGAYTINPMSFTDNGDGTVTDNISGLMWQKQDDGTLRTWSQATTYCDDLSLGGHSDWRLPSKKELISIVDYGVPGAAIDPIYFPNAKMQPYWSSTTYIDYTANAWGVHFYDGSVSNGYSKSDFYFTRCVRGSQSGSSDNFTDNGNGTVIHNVTGLMWQKGEGGQMAWQSALSYCEGLSLGGHEDWRLPNVKELESITDVTRYNPAASVAFFPDINVLNYWSATTTVSSRNRGWHVFFGDGSIFNSNKSDGCFVRCVHGAPAGTMMKLSVSKIGTGSGNITADQGTINWNGAAGTASYLYETSVTLTASSADGSIFLGWSGACTGIETCTINMNADRNVNAAFLSIKNFVFKLPDTGQTNCYEGSGNVIACGGTGQDGAYVINPVSFTESGNNTVMDDNTGLMWQKADDGIARNWEQSVAYCDSLTLDGYSDWRLPSKKELMTIVDYGIFGPAINRTFFPNTQSSYYWTSVTYADPTGGNPARAWLVSFYGGWAGGGSIRVNAKSSNNFVRCVRGERYDSAHLIDNGNGTVQDIKTGLVWQKDETGWIGWQSALSYCEGLSLGGHEDWRLPNIKELVTITDDMRYNPAVDNTFFPLLQPESYFKYWSSTTDSSAAYYQWFLDSTTGEVNSYSTAMKAKCVRGGRSGTFGKVQLPRTGQWTSYVSGDDGAIQAGVIWPNPRFVDNGDQTVTDNLTGLVWTRDAGTPTIGSCTGGYRTWQGALDYVLCLNVNNYLGHNDWRLPDINELKSLINMQWTSQAIWLNEQGFSNVRAYYYRSSSTSADNIDNAWIVDMAFGGVYNVTSKTSSGYMYVWPVRGGQCGTIGNAICLPKTGQTTK